MTTLRYLSAREEETTMKSRVLAVFLGVVFALLCFPALAQFPSKAVDIVVPYPAGGGTDLAARVIAKGLQEKWKVPVRVVNMPGGNTFPGVDNVMRAPPDGHKVLMDGMSSSTLLQLVVPDMPFKVSDRTFITYNVRNPMILIVPQDSPFKNIADVIVALKKNPREVSWSSLGGTGVSDMAFRQLFRIAGVPYANTRAVVTRGGAEVAVQTAGGHIMVGGGSHSSFASFIASGKVRVLAVFGPQRSKLTPDVPSMTELGHPEAVMVQWNGFTGPLGMPNVAIQKWHTSIQELLTDPEVITGLTRLGIEPFPSQPGDLAKDMEKEMKVLGDLIKAGSP